MDSGRFIYVFPEPATPGRVLGIMGSLPQPQSLFVVVVLLFFSPLTTEAAKTLLYPVEQLDALQTLWAEWNKSTPNLDSNLAGWSSTQRYPCWQSVPKLKPNWQGVLCIESGPNCTTLDCNGYIIGLTLNNASITGILPPEIGNIFSLISLELTGNPNLTGPLPWEIQQPDLYYLDLHDNGFNGTLPQLTYVSTLLNVDLSGNQFVGEFPYLQIREWTYLKELNLARNHFTGSIPTNAFVNMTQLESLDLSGNKLTGALPNFTMCKKLKFLYLDDNSISGTLDIAQLLALGLVHSNGSEGLTTLSLTNNNITNLIYTEGSIANITTTIRLQGNPYCKKDADDGTRCFCQQLCGNQGSQSNSSVIIIAALTSSGVAFLIILVVVAAVLCRTQRYKRYLILQLQQKFEEHDVKPTIYAYTELRAATRDFHPDMKLGEGGYGAVYKGVLPNKSTVAVKQLLIKNTQGVDDFLNEVVLITGMKHRNLVNLKGCCLREHQRLLIYEYVDNYDVDQVLLRGENKTPLSWAVRENICLGVAHGLHYLHSHAHPKIIHRDIKASNILLDKSFNPKIADFGLALLFPDEKSHIMTVHIAGTKGYVAPEYASLGQLSEKVDVFSFGVLCLEVLSGRRNLDETMPLDEVYLCNWARALHKEGKLMDLVDPTLVFQDDEKKEVQRLINVALLCTQNTAEQRPTMARVVAMLQSDRESEVEVLTAGMKEQQLGSLQMLVFGEDTELATVTEGETTSLNPRSIRRGSLRSDDNLA